MKASLRFILALLLLAAGTVLMIGALRTQRFYRLYQERVDSLGLHPEALFYTEEPAVAGAERSTRQRLSDR